MREEINITRVRDIVRECHFLLTDLSHNNDLPIDVHITVNTVNDLITEIYISDWHIRSF